jgi:apurinic endonuclease APN1
VLIENTAGAGLTVGRTPDEVASILAAVPKKLRPRTGYGLDTCHLFAAGHDIHTSAKSLAGVLDLFEAACGEPPSFFHLNDSEFPFASNRDRHALIGEGQIGAEPFRWLLADRRSRGIPLILETPQQDYEIAESDASPDPFDLRMMALLREFSA